MCSILAVGLVYQIYGSSSELYFNVIFSVWGALILSFVFISLLDVPGE